MICLCIHVAPMIAFSFQIHQEPNLIVCTLHVCMEMPLPLVGIVQLGVIDPSHAIRFVSDRTLWLKEHRPSVEAPNKNVRMSVHWLFDRSGAGQCKDKHRPCVFQQ